MGQISKLASWAKGVGQAEKGGTSRGSPLYILVRWPGGGGTHFLLNWSEGVVGVPRWQL